ncbi:hypothetical protein [Synechocystis sp. PCC 7509]|uniref:hypothetical protein n=1 Tax=Synechocystis sp. PCC 7509 TaxID=927677 RepID=UPI00048E2ECD|nr:hypothetical protein [Synechocystis sp. PCC 7509]
MLGRLGQKLGKAIGIALIAIALLSTVSCSRGNATTTSLARGSNNTVQRGDIVEVSPPEVIQTLRQDLEIYQPQVTIVSPEADAVFEDDKVKVRLQVRDLSIFKNPQLELGPHLHVILDNQPYIAVYDLNKPLTLEGLEPGTHTMRVFASRPWHESFKNAGAYAQTTFHVFTKTQNNNPDSALPLLTYSRPKGTYGAEPILLDFYLTNAPLRLAATDSNIADWRIRCTINGYSFVLDSWQSAYLQGFKPGKNWVQLEFIDSQGNSVKNVFNNTVRTITYEPNSKDTLAKLVTGELSAELARGIVDQNYTVKIPEPLPTPTETPIPEPSFEPLPTPTETPIPEPSTEIPSPEPVIESLPIPTEIPSPEPLIAPLPTPTETLTEDKVKLSGRKQLGDYFNRLRRTSIKTAPNLPSIPETTDIPVETLSPNLAPEID